MYASLQTVLLVVYSMHVMYKYSYVVTVGIAIYRILLQVLFSEIVLHFYESDVE